MTSVLRTADARFEGLADYPFAPHYTMISDPALGMLRMHHVAEGPADGPVVLLMHGEPSWSYLYRRMIPPLAAAGLRVLAPDLIGFGRSDKPARREDYSYAAHVRWMSAWLTAQDLRDATLFCQDWGGLIGLRLVAAFPERFARVIASNTFLPTGASPLSEAFQRWRGYSQKVPDFDSGAIVHGATARGIDEAARAAYNAPFPDESYKAGARAFPMLVPTTPDDPEAAVNREAWARLADFPRPFVTAFGDSDPVTAGGDRVMQRHIAGAAAQPHRVIADAGHFIQEDAPDALVEVILEAVGR